MGELGIISMARVGVGHLIDLLRLVGIIVLFKEEQRYRTHMRGNT